MTRKTVKVLFVGIFLLVSIRQSLSYDFTPSTNPQTVTTNISLSSGNNTFTIPAEYLSTFTGVLSNASNANPGTLVKTGDGILELTGANTYSGGTLLQGGTIRLGNDAALGVWPATSADGNVQGLVTVSGTGTIEVDGNRTIANRFITADAASMLSFDIASGTTLTILNVANAGTNTNGYGAVLFTSTQGSEPIFTGGGNLVVQGNRSAFGGGFSSMGNTGVVGFDLTELASVQFLNNAAVSGNGGAVHVSASETSTVNLEFGDHVTISGNSATTSGTSGDGGAVFAYSSYGTTVRFGNFATFSDNQANRFGGAFYVYATQSGQTADLFLGTNTLFENNRSKALAAAQSGGGAIYSTHNVSISGNTLFRDNTAMSFGGAIFMKGREAGTLLLDTTSGDIGFTGNYMNATNIDTPATGTANSVYLDTLTTLRIQGTGNVFFDDPIASSDKTGNQMVLGRTASSDPASTAFSGIVQLRGNSTVQNNFSVQVGEGILRLTNGAQLAGAATGSFTLGTDGTLAGSGMLGFATNTLSGTVAADSAVFTMSNWSNTTNSFAAGTGKTTIDAGETVGTLTFTGATKFDGATILVDIDASAYDQIVVNNAVTFGTTKNNTITITDAAAGGTYNVITSNQTIGNDPADYFNLAGNIAGYTGFGRYDATVQYGSVGGTNNVVQVVIDADGGNTTLYWTGLDSDQWIDDVMAGPRNWTDVPGGTATETRFLGGDRVVFDTTSTVEDRFDVNIGSGPMVVADMTVTGSGDYTITGNIRSATASETTLTDATGKLLKDGTGTLTLNGTNSFIGGVEITGGTLKATTVDSVGGNVTLSNASTLQFDNTAGGTFASNITGAGNLTKTGTGMLTLQGVNDYVGTTTVGAGTLVGDIASGTDLIVSSGAVYNADGADRSVSSLNGAGTVDMTGKSFTVSSGNFTDGGIINADTIQKTGDGIFAIGQTEAGNLNHTAGTLIIAEEESLILTGTTTIGDGTTLGIGVGDGTAPSLQADGGVSIGGGTTINLTGYNGITGDPLLLIESVNSTITFTDFDSIVFMVGGRVLENELTINQFVNDLHIARENGDKELWITSGGLVWNNTGNPDAHGTFYVETGATATMAEPLADNTNENATINGKFGWDGKTLTKTGGGRLTLNYANTYTGDTDIQAGTLVVRNVQALGTVGQATIAEGATLILNYSSGNPFANHLSDAGNLVTQNNVLIDQANTGFTGTTTVSAGTLTLQDVNALGSSAVTNDSALVLDFTGTFANALTGGGILTLAGTPARTVTISRDNTGFTGPTTIDTGATLNMQNASALGTSAITNSGTLNLDGFAGTTFANLLSDGGQLNINDSVTISRSNTGFTGNTNITTGTTTLQSAGALGITGGSTAGQTVTNDGTLQFALSNGGIFAPNLTGSGDLVANVGGILTLTGTNTYAGSTTVNTGTLAGNIADGTTLTVASGAAYKNGTDDSTQLDRTLASLNGAGNVDLQGKNLTVAKGDFSDGIISNVATLTKTGTDTLTVGQTGAADLDHSAGTLNIASGKTITLAGSATIADNTLLGVGPNISLTAGGTVSIGSGTTLDVTGYDASMGKIVLIDAGSDIANDFGTYLIDGEEQSITISIDQYVNTSPIVQRNAADLSQIVIDTGGLVWNNTAPGTAHGTFNVPGTATVGDNLVDNTTDGPGFGWDGKTLTKNGNGTLTLTGNNGYTGGTDVNGGKIVGTTGTAFGTGTVTTGNGTTVEFNITGTGPATTVNDITGGGTFVKTGGGTLIHTGGSTYTGGTVVSGGTLVSDLPPASVAPPCGTPLVVTAGTTYRTYSGDQSMSSLTGSGTVNMQAYTDNLNKNLTVCSGDFSAGTLLNVATLTKKNADTSFIVGTATVGALNLDEGTLVLAQQQTLTVTGATTIADNTTLSLANNPALVTGSLSIGDTKTILDVCGCSLDGWVVKSDTNITDRFTEVLIGGGTIDNEITIDQFLNGVEVLYVDADDPVNPGGPGILLKSGGLVWNNNMDGMPNQAHGTFNITSTFTVIQQLKDREAGDYVPVENWDGKTLTKTGDGTLTLANGTNSYSGGTNIQSGRIVVQVEGSLGSGEVRNNGILEYALTGDGTLANDVSGTGSFIKSGTGTLTVTGTNTYTGGTTVNSGTLVSNLAAPTDDRPCGTELYVAAGAVYSPYNKNQFVSDLYGAGTVDMNGYDLTVCEGDFSDGDIKNVGTLTKTTGSGLPTTLTVGDVSAENLYLQVGTLTIAPEKTVTLSGDANIASSTALSVTAGKNPALTAEGSLNLGDNLGNATTLVVLGYDSSMGTVVLIDVGTDIARDFSVYMLNGTDQKTVVTLDHYRNTSPLIQRNADDLSQIIISTGGLVWNNTAPSTAHGTFQVDTDDIVTENLRDNTVDTAWAFGWDGKTLTKTGTGNLTLTGENTYTGGTDIQTGTITATNENSLGTGAVDIDTDGKLVLSFDGTANNTLRGDGDLEIDGNINIVKSNGDFSGNTVITTGTTTLQRVDGLGDSDITLKDGTTLFFNTASSGTSANTISGTGNLLKGGAGTLTLENDILTTGTTTIRGGTLIANLVPADPDTLPCGAALTVNAGTTFQAKSRDQSISVLTGSGTVNMNGFDLTVCSGDFTGGTFANLKNVTKKSDGTLTLGGFEAVDFTLQEGTFILAPEQTITLSGAATIGANTVFDIAANLALTAVGTVTIDGTATLNIDGYTGQDSVVLVHSDTEIIGDFGTYTINGVEVETQTPSLDRYYIVKGIEKTENDIAITGAHLAWYDPNEHSAHGTFRIDSGTATISDDLDDVTDSSLWFVENGQTLWDGKTLTKTGAGTLVLSGENTYTGDTVIHAGSIVATGEKSLGGPGGVVRFEDNAVTLVFRYSTDGTFAKTVTGGGTIRKTDGNVLTVTSDLSGMTGVFRQDDGTVVFQPAGNTFAGSYEQRGGTFEGVDGLTIAQNASFEGIVRTNGTLNIGGTAEIGAGSVVNIGAYLGLDVAGTVTIDDAAALNVAGYAGQGEVLLIHSESGIIGDFGTYTVNGVDVSEQKPSLDVYYLVGGIRKTEHDIFIDEAHLAWYDPNDNSAHGTFKIVSGTVTISETLNDVTDSRLWLTDENGNTLWDGKTLTKTGDGTLVLDAANTYTDGTDIQSGTVTAKNENALGTGTVDIAGKLVLDYDGNMNNTFQGTGDLEIDGNITVAKSNAGFSGSTAVTTGTTTLQQADGLGSSKIDLADGTTLEFDTADDGIASNDIAGNGNLVKQGGGALELTGTNVYTGATTVSAGTLVGNIASGTDLEVATNAVYRSGEVDRIVSGLTGGGTVDMQGHALTVGNGEFCAGTLSNVGSFTKNTSGRLDIGGFAAAEFHLDEGTLAICNNGRIDVGGTAVIGDDTIFDIGAVLSLVAAGTITIGTDATLNISGYGGKGEVILVHSDTEIIGDFEHYTINGTSLEDQIPSLDRYSIVKGIEESETTIWITDAHLAWDDPGDESAHGTFLIASGTVTISESLGNVEDPNLWLTDDNGNALWDGETLTKTGAGTLVLDAANTYTGNTLVTAGTVVATNEASLGRIDGGGTVNVDAGANLEIRYTADGTFSKTVLGGGTIRKTDGNTLTVASNLSDMTGDFIQATGTVDWQSGRFGGSYTQQSGKLLGNGTMSLGGDAMFQGEVVPGGAMTVDGSVTLSGADLYVNLYLDETHPETTADFISGTTITIDGGTLHVDDKGVAADYVHGSATFIVLKSTDGITGDFDTVTGLTSIFKETHGVVGNDYVIELSMKEIPFDPFAPNHNTKEVVTTINNGIDDPDFAPIVDVLINMDTDGDLLHAIDTMRGTEIVADGQTLALWSPWRAVFNRLYDDRTKTACGPCDSVCSTKKNARNVWFEGYYRSEDVSDDGNARSYDTRRAGLMVGLDTQLNRRLTVGGVFGYGDPRLSSRYGRIETDDYTVALYGKLKLNRHWFTNAFVGYGRQEYDYRRHDFAGNYRAKYDGDAMYASLELLRPIKGRFVTWTPVAAVDFQKSWVDAFTERGTGFLQNVRKGELSRTELRFGLNAKTRWNQRIDLLGRIQYSRQVGGNTRGTAESRFAMAPDSRTMNLLGVNLGRDRLNVGVGANLLVGARKQSMFFCDYDFDYGKNSRAHTRQLGFSTKW